MARAKLLKFVLDEKTICFSETLTNISVISWAIPALRTDMDCGENQLCEGGNSKRRAALHDAQVVAADDL